MFGGRWEGMIVRRRYNSSGNYYNEHNVDNLFNILNLYPKSTDMGGSESKAEHKNNFNPN